MANSKQAGFLSYKRVEPQYRDVEVRKDDFNWVEQPLSEEELIRQAKRCMDCGVPFCHTYGCPLENRVPDYMDEVSHGNWQRALEILHSTNNFPEFTGRICPALCEASCTLSLGYDSTLCRHIELAIVEKGWSEGWITPQPAAHTTGMKVVVIGSGPAGLAAAQQLARYGHKVTVFEKSDRIGGMLRYGIPNFKLEKYVIDRRIAQLTAEGIVFETGVEVGNDISARYLMNHFDAILLTSGISRARDLAVPGRDLKGIHFAMDLLTQQTKLVLGDEIPEKDFIDPGDKHVVVIGGGDTGADCVGTCTRRGAKSVTQLELLPKPLEERAIDNPWPEWPVIMRTSSSHLEGCIRLWSILTKDFYGSKGRVEKVRCAKIIWEGQQFKEIPGSDFLLNADLVLLSMGFIPDKDSSLVKDFGITFDIHSGIDVDGRYVTSRPGVFATGDAVTGPSLVVRAIRHGRDAADSMHEHLMQT